MAYVRQPRSVRSPHPRRLPLSRRAGTRWPTSGTGQAGILAAAVFGLFALDASLRPPGRLDVATMKLVQRIDHPKLGPWLEVFERLTDSSGAVLAWAIAVAVFAAWRWWIPVLGCLAIPLGGVVNEFVSRVLIQRTRPHLEELRHVSQNFEERSFPSGHVVGAFLLYGFIWYVAGQRIPHRFVVASVRACAGAVIVATGFDRIWSGAHWPSDVAGGYALGAGLLAALILASRWVERFAPRWKAASRAGTLLS